MRVRKRSLLQKFFADRGPHLAAMIAYFALLSFVPLLFLALSLLGLVHRAQEGGYLVTELKKAFPGSSVSSIVSKLRGVQENAATLGIVGGVAVLWTSLSLFSVLESAFNIVYGRPNRSFLRGKGMAVLLMVSSLVTLFFGLLVGSVGADVLKRYAPGFAGNGIVAYLVSILGSTLAVFVFLGSVYYVLTNVDLRLRDILPGTITATILAEASFQALPIFVRLSQVNVALKTLGGPALLLVWLYVMGNVIVFGAEMNWWWVQRREARLGDERLPEQAPGLA